MTLDAAEEDARAGRAAAAPTRLDSLDLLRGLVLVVMALDHVRDFMHYATRLFDPTYSITPGQVIWTIGWSMIVLSALARLPTWAVTASALPLVRRAQTAAARRVVELPVKD